MSGLLGEIHTEPSTTGVLLVVGHEPTWSDAITAFIGGGTVRFPTAAVARVDFDVERWADVRAGTGELAWIVPPRLLG